MAIHYKNQEPVILAVIRGMRLTGWSGDFDGLRIFAVSNWGECGLYYRRQQKPAGDHDENGQRRHSAEIIYTP